MENVMLFEDLPECDLRDFMGFYWSLAKLKLGSNANSDDLRSTFCYLMSDFIAGINDYRAVENQMELMISQFIDIMGEGKYREITSSPFFNGELDTSRKVYLLVSHYSEFKND